MTMLAKDGSTSGEIANEVGDYIRCLRGTVWNPTDGGSVAASCLSAYTLNNIGRKMAPLVVEEQA